MMEPIPEQEIDAPKQERPFAHRRSRKSLAGRVDDTMWAIDKEIESGNQKPARLVALTTKLESLMALLKRDDAANQNGVVAENATLKSQHLADASEIAKLRQRVAALESKKPEVIREIVPDPEAAAIRDQNAVLTGLVEHLASQYDTEARRAQAAIRVITSCPPAVAKIFCPLVDIKFELYSGLLRTYKTYAELQSIIEKALREGPLVVFAKAALAVRDAAIAKAKITAPDQPFVPDTRSGEEKLRAAKESVRQAGPRPLVTDHC